MGKKGKIHNIRDIFPNTNLLEGATLTQADDGTFQIKNFTIIKAGESASGNYYSPQTLAMAARDKVFEGKTFRTDHPEKGKEHSVRDIVGKVERTYFSEETQSLKGDGFMSSTAGDLVIKAEEGLIGDLSINARGETEIERHSGDKLRRNVKVITEGYSVDLVCEAAAGGTLHEEFQRNKQLCERMKKRMDGLEKLTIEELTEARPDLIQKLTEAAKKADPPPEEKKKEEVKPVTSEQVTTLVTEAVTKVFTARDEESAKKNEASVLTEAISKAVTDVLAESGASDSVKSFVEKALVPFATESFDSLDSISNEKLSEERDRVLAEFDALAKNHVKESDTAGSTTTETGKKGARLTDLLVVA